MSPGALNGRLKFTWAQFVWGVGATILVVSTWKDLRSGLTSVEQLLKRVETALAGVYTKGEIDNLRAAAEAEHAVMRARIIRIERKLGIE